MVEEGDRTAGPSGGWITAACVLLVDDDPVLAEVYRLGLDRAGWDALVANSGPAGLELARARQPGFIFLDIRMPGMSGIDVLKELSRDTRTRHIPVAMLSNYSDPDMVTECLALGAKEYLVKAGTNPALLGDVVARWLPRS